MLNLNFMKLLVHWGRVGRLWCKVLVNRRFLIIFKFERAGGVLFGGLNRFDGRDEVVDLVRGAGGSDRASLKKCENTMEEGHFWNSFLELNFLKLFIQTRDQILKSHSSKNARAISPILTRGRPRLTSIYSAFKNFGPTTSISVFKVIIITTSIWSFFEPNQIF